MLHAAPNVSAWRPASSSQNQAVANRAFFHVDMLNMTNTEFARLHRMMCQIRYLLLNAEKWEWAAWMDRGVALMEQRDPEAIERFLSAFGGIDGIDHNVAVSMQMRDVTAGALDEVNSALAAILTEAYVVARQLREVRFGLPAVGDCEEPQSVEVLASR